MLGTLLPLQFDNRYSGTRLGLWVFAVVVAMKTAMALNTIFNGRFVATSADGIPLDSFTPQGAQTAIALFAIWGLAQLMLCSVCGLALVRYRSMVPLLLVVLLVEHLSRRGILQVIPITRSGTPPGTWVNHALLGLMLVGLPLALWKR